MCPANPSTSGLHCLPLPKSPRADGTFTLVAYASRPQDVPKLAIPAPGPRAPRSRRASAGQADDRLRASGGGVARARAASRNRRGHAGFPLTVRLCIPAGLCEGSPHRAADGPAHPAIEGADGMSEDESGYFDTRRAGGGLSRPLAPHAGGLPRERRRSRLPPVWQPGAVLQAGPRRLGGEAARDHDRGGGPAEGGMTSSRSGRPGSKPVSCRRASGVGFDQGVFGAGGGQHWGGYPEEHSGVAGRRFAGRGRGVRHRPLPLRWLHGFGGIPRIMTLRSVVQNHRLQPPKALQSSPGAAMRYPTPRSLKIQAGFAALSPSLRRRLRTTMRTRFALAPLRPAQTRRSSVL